jgi:hypothetical protein
MLAFCDGDEDTKLFKRHRADPSAATKAASKPSARVLTAVDGGRETEAPGRRGLRLVREVCEIVDNRRDVLRVDWPLVRIPHLLDLGLPDGAG